MALTVKGMRAHPDWLRQWRGGERSPYPAATPHDIAWHFGREIDRQNPGETIEDDSIDTGLLPVAAPPDHIRHDETPEPQLHPMDRPVPTSEPLVERVQLREEVEAPLVAAGERIRILRENAPGRFSLEPLKEEATKFRGTHFIGKKRVAQHDAMIEQEAKRQGVDPDLVRAVVYTENARGWFKDDVLLKQLAEPLGIRERDTVLPMNIHRDVWRTLVQDEKDFFDPEKNIRAGVTLIKRIGNGWTIHPQKRLRRCTTKRTEIRSARGAIWLGVPMLHARGLSRSGRNVQTQRLIAFPAPSGR